MAVILRILLVIFFFYVILIVFLFFNQRSMVYFPLRKITDTPAAIGLPYREIIFKTSDGLQLCGWMVGDEDNRDVVLFCHGNAGNISHRLESFDIFHRIGLRCFIFDYRGYGKSEGEPSEQGTYRDVEAAWQYLIETENIPSQRIILFGRSLGGAVAAHLAARLDVNARALILESTFTSVPDLGAQWYPFFPIRMIIRFHYNTKALLAKIKLPVLVIHSPQDELIPFNHGKALFEAAKEPKQFLRISGSHNEGFSDSREEYIIGFRGFLERSR
ncbi:MAG: alpha/beta fold hydrolase [Candidatus Aminicenantes bacterium]|nr:alpha/beta fold hydrolase [Candidatus Aminicenantes bacterium]NIM81640.1 alpha/beta fold hydrolase [Candidatus Aminicenantes bacterium]NIN21010.1 alpha/beta fold hydrolase [Candidatus Aminicenantes bacterium]NIN44831.1 alpha/beta fold hydrolase [Candidatus Aminicenantes bacterium]NIN87639.1 alpha/beta fold hydrolase [Candidatus Aminicenantes bacterium]